ncbi:response regulator transcription factor [Advenella mimigardefordensis]|uniref:Two component transcriptional regulator, CheY-like superfamily n=1 Tax=Advenella mimigardefordensis (strain DSM 17166 / LMG 22922 / DPN7) TaxID=1247726 RepID=W0PKH2_ADVMD|nr:response regulator transcription factor [Advenella mimigardefordensis]AHG66060.1 two component transcriptional regulator, CheY-like superfamily [Advenella mimigardefordensis DPN7]
MKIAILEDDLAQATQMVQAVEKMGYGCKHYSSGKELMSALRDPESFDLLILDWELPEITGKDVLIWVRSNIGYSLPILFLTSRTSEEDLVEAIEAGADDYISKPYTTEALRVRVLSLLRRANPTDVDNTMLEIGPYQIDTQMRSVRLHDEVIALAPKEFDLAVLFFRNMGRLFSRDALSAAIWNREIPATSRTLDTHLSNVRQKLQIRPENGLRIVSSYALGYRLEPVSESAAADTAAQPKETRVSGQS